MGAAGCGQPLGEWSWPTEFRLDPTRKEDSICNMDRKFPIRLYLWLIGTQGNKITVAKESACKYYLRQDVTESFAAARSWEK